MANEVLFAGGRIDSLSISGSVAENTSASRFNATYADCATAPVGTSDQATASFLTLSGGVPAATDVVTGETVFAHFDLFVSTSSLTNNITVATLYDSSGFPWLTIRTTSTSTVGLFYNSGTGASPTWTQIGSSWSHSISTMITYDIKLTLGSPHTVELSINGSVSIAATTFTQASLTSLRSFRINGPSGSSGGHFSQILITRGIPTSGAFVKYSRATAAGTNTGWTGAYTDVNEAIGSDATVNTAASSGLKQSFAMGDVTVPAGYAIKAVFTAMRAKNNGGAPANVQSLLRSSGTDYSSGTLTFPPMSTSFQAMLMRYDTDPATGVAWTQAGWNAAEAGFESLT